MAAFGCQRYTVHSPRSTAYGVQYKGYLETAFSRNKKSLRQTHTTRIAAMAQG